MSAQVTVLQFVTGKYEGQEFALEADHSIAGRSSEADLVLADDAVSRKHARFYPRRGRFWVRDLGSRNGTRVNGERVDYHCLREGDRISIGSSLCRVVLKSSSEVSQRRAGERQEGRNQPLGVGGRSMTGSIEDIPLMDVLQWLATSRKSGNLKVRDPASKREGALYLRNGRVFYAIIGNNRSLPPEKALLRMLNWDKGLFELDNSVIKDPPSEIDVSLEHMLMDAARQQDELAELAKSQPLPHARSKIKFPKGSATRWKDLQPEQLDLLQDLVAAGSWWEFIDTSAADEVQLYRTLVALKKLGVVDYS